MTGWTGPAAAGKEDGLRAQLATATRVLAQHQLVGMFGHVSVLTDDPRTYLVCPGAGARKDRCRASDVIELDLDHEFAPGLPLELYMHSEVHRLKPHIRSLIHVHSPGLVALAAMAQVPTDLLMMHASFWPEVMPIWEEPDLVRDRAAARKLIEILGDEAMALLRWHGAVIVGQTLQEALMRAILAEEHAQQLVTALSHGRPLAPVPRTVNRAELQGKVLSPRTHDMHFGYAATFVPVEPGARGAQ
jgi:HCOMODA/2-hydroxy-3-carboxy-muconic semialdehyde decarboxylase